MTQIDVYQLLKQQKKWMSNTEIRKILNANQPPISKALRRLCKYKFIQCKMKSDHKFPARTIKYYKTIAVETNENK